MGESMRKIILLAAVLLLATAMTACGGDTAPTELSSVTEAPTDAPYIDTQISEPEWTLAEGVLQLEDDNNVYAAGADILYFAIVTNADGKQELWFRLDDKIAAELQSNSTENAYFMTFNGERVGAANLNDDCTIAKISDENADGEITAWASEIRGLS